MDKKRQQNPQAKKNKIKQKSPTLELTPREYVRSRPAFLIGKLGDGSSCDDGIYTLLNYIIDNAIDEYRSGFGKEVDIKIYHEENRVSVRDYGRTIPFSKLIEVVSYPETNSTFDNHTFKTSEWKIRIVNALSGWFKVQSHQKGKIRTAYFSEGNLTYDSEIITSDSNNSGTLIEFIPDSKIFGNCQFLKDHAEHYIWNYIGLNRGLTIHFNDHTYYSNGISDLLEHKLQYKPLYPIIHIIDGDFEAAFTHVEKQTREQYYSFVNDHHTSRGGSHEIAFDKAFTRIIKNFFKNYHTPKTIINKGLVCALTLRMKDPIFDDALWRVMNSQHIGPDNPDGTNDSPLMTTYVYDILQRHIGSYLNTHPETANTLLQIITNNVQ